jgi:hypothetical protein
VRPGGDRIDGGRGDLGRPRGQREDAPHDRRAGDEAEVARQGEEPGHDTALGLVHAAHHGGIVRGLEDREACRQRGERAHVPRDAGRRRQQRERAGAEHHGGEPGERHGPGTEAVDAAAGGNSRERGDQRSTGHDQAGPRGVQPQGAHEMERTDNERRHRHRRGEAAREHAAAHERIAEQREPHQRRGRARLPAREEERAGAGEQEQAGFEGAGSAAPHGHRQRIGGERQREQDGSRHVEPGAYGGGPVRRNVAVRQDERERADGHLDQEHRGPAPGRDQEAAHARAERGADGRQRPEQAHGGSDARLRDVRADQRERQRHHHRGAGALHGARGHEQPQRRRRGAGTGRQREEADAGDE